MRLIDELGKRRMLTVVKTVDFGVYLGTKEERVLLPKKEVPEGTEAGDPVEVFLYKDIISQKENFASQNSTPLKR